jgi:hypothetical protein
MFESFQDREAQTSAAISQAINRNQSPKWFHSYSEYCSALAAAYRDRERFWTDVVRHCIDGPANAEHVVFTALLDARERCQDAAWHYEHEAVRIAREDQAEAFHSYAPNIAATTEHTAPPARRVLAA